MLSKQHELDLPMGSHNYLYKIMAGLSDKIEATTERNAEKGIQSGSDTARDAKARLVYLKSELRALEQLYRATPSEELQKQINELHERIKQN